jgi:hypothetical protein
MRKILIVSLGLATVGGLVNVQPAFAEKKTICEWHLTGAYIGDVQTGPLGIGFKVCRVVDGPPTPKTPWHGTRDYGKPINELKTKRAF